MLFSFFFTLWCFLFLCRWEFYVAELSIQEAEEIFTMIHPTDKIQKNMLHGRSRLVFVAGLEGTGHHAWSDMFTECIANKTCEVAIELTQAMMHFDHVKHTVHGLFGAIDSNINSEQLTKLMDIMQNLANKPGDHLYVVGLCFVHLSAMLSYPNYNGLHKALDHPDISTLAAAAEWAGLDLRVILLQRDAKDILTSTARRNIGGREEPKILLDNAAALYAQMSLIDSKFYHCINYKELGHLSPMGKDTLAQFLHPSLIPPIIDKMLAKVVYNGPTLVHILPHFSSRAGVHGENAERLESEMRRDLAEQSGKYHEWQLAQRLHLIDQLCQDQQPVLARTLQQKKV